MHAYDCDCTGESSQGFYSVYCGMDCMSGGLVCLYEWMIPCKTQRKGDTRRSRQVLIIIILYHCLPLLLQVASIRQEYESFNDKLIKHSSIIPYLTMKHNITEHGILVEVCHINIILIFPSSGWYGVY